MAKVKLESLTFDAWWMIARYEAVGDAIISAKLRAALTKKPHRVMVETKRGVWKQAQYFDGQQTGRDVLLSFFPEEMEATK